MHLHDILQTIGSSAAQSSTLPCFDVALGVVHGRGQTQASRHSVTVILVLVFWLPSVSLLAAKWAHKLTDLTKNSYLGRFV